MDDRLFLILLFPSIFISTTIFFVGLAVILKASIEYQQMKKQLNAQPPHGAEVTRGVPTHG